MFAKQAIRSSIVALALTGLTAAPSVARPEGAPATPSQQPHAAVMYKDYSKNGASGDVAPPTADGAAVPAIPPRTEGMGAQPQHGPYAATRPAPSVKAQALRATSDSNPVDWTSVMLGASGVLAALLAGFVARSVLRRGHVARVS
jgi:hypothetical protein